MRSERLLTPRWMVLVGVSVGLIVVGLLAFSEAAYGQPSFGGSWIRNGSQVSGSVSPGRWCEYRFEGQVGDVVTINMMRGSLSDPYLSLYDPRGNQVASDDDSALGNNSRITYTLVLPGTYRIQARSYNRTDSGSFTLSLCGQSLDALSGNKSGFVSPGGGTCQYAFWGSGGECVSVKMNIDMTARNNALDPWLDLVDPAGNIIASDDDSNGGRDSWLQKCLDWTGRYVVVARSYDRSVGGAFQLNYTRR